MLFRSAPPPPPRRFTVSSCEYFGCRLFRSDSCDSLDDWNDDSSGHNYFNQSNAGTSFSLYQPRAAFSNMDEYARYIKQHIRVSGLVFSLSLRSLPSPIVQRYLLLPIVQRYLLPPIVQRYLLPLIVQTPAAVDRWEWQSPAASHTRRSVKATSVTCLK